MRSRAPSLQSAMTTRLPCALSAATCRVSASNTLRPGSARSTAKLRPCLVPASMSGPCPSRDGEARGRRGGWGRGSPFGFAEVEPVGRQRLIRRARSALGERLLARLVIVLDLTEPLVGGVLGQRFEYDRGTRHVIEQRIESIVKQRQPVLHAGKPPALPYRLVKH